MRVSWAVEDARTIDDNLGALPPPDAKAALAERYAATVQSSVQEWDEAMGHDERLEKRPMARALRRYRDDTAESYRIAGQIGFRVCGGTLRLG